MFITVLVASNRRQCNTKHLWGKTYMYNIEIPILCFVVVVVQTFHNKHDHFHC